MKSEYQARAKNGDLDGLELDQTQLTEEEKIVQVIHFTKDGVGLFIRRTP